MSPIPTTSQLSMLYPTIMLPNIFNIAGKTAIVTGASYGLGATFAEALAVAAADVAPSARNQEKMGEGARRNTGKGGTHLAIPSRPGDVRPLGAMVAFAWC